LAVRMKRSTEKMHALRQEMQVLHHMLQRILQTVAAAVPVYLHTRQRLMRWSPHR